MATGVLRIPFCVISVDVIDICRRPCGRACLGIARLALLSRDPRSPSRCGVSLAVVCLPARVGRGFVPLLVLGWLCSGTRVILPGLVRTLAAMADLCVTAVCGVRAHGVEGGAVLP